VRGEADAARARLAEALAGKEAAERRARDLEGQIMRIKTEEVATLQGMQDRFEQLQVTR